MSRLSSFRGPSTPTSSPVQYKHRPPSSPASPSRLQESTYHRKIRSSMLEIRAITETWDDLVLIDGLKAARTLVDTRTELENALSITPDRLPRTHIVGPKITIMEKCIAELDNVVTKLKKQFVKLNAIIDSMEAVLIEAHKMKGWQWVQKEPLWTSWSLEKFVNSASQILLPYHRSLSVHIQLLEVLRSHSTPFEKSRDAILQWAQQQWLEDEGWTARWEDICSVEIDRWDRAK